MNEVTKIDGIGSSVRRTEDKKFLTGKGKYTDDINRLLMSSVSVSYTHLTLPTIVSV